ncbi:hypothetical protein MMC13_005606 [Lambiella insularis]|nr:hypothetical protein [Lambiella insularis]
MAASTNAFDGQRNSISLATQENENTIREPEDDPEINTAIEREYKETMDLERCLRAHYIYLDRRTEMPHDLQLLKTFMVKPRQSPPSPISQKIASANRYTRNLSELDAMILLENFLGYVPQDSLGGDGESGLTRSHNQQWNVNVVPIPATEHDESLASAIKAVESPPEPKPDITYGYSLDQFSSSEINHVVGLSPATRVTDKEPLWPFLIMEWKSNLGMMDNCRLQAMRDGAAAVNSLWHLFHETGTAQPPEYETAVFCACVGPDIIEIYISWRRNHPIEGLSWEMDRIFRAFLDDEDQVFNARSVLLNILDWARSTRLDRIKAVLRPLKRVHTARKKACKS